MKPLLLILLTFSLTACFSSKDSDPTNGRRPTLDSPPPTGVDENGETVSCEVLRAQDEESFAESKRLQAEEYDKALTQLGQEYQAREAKRASDYEKEIAENQSLVDGSKSAYDNALANILKEKQVLLSNIEVHKQEVANCVASKKVANPQEFHGMLYHLDLPEDRSNPRSLEFINGQASQHSFKTRILVGKPDNLQSFNLEGGPKGLLVKRNKVGTWTLNWKPNYQFKPNQDIITETVVLKPNINNFSKEQMRLLGKEDLSTKIMLIVRKAPPVATKVRVQNLPREITQGASVKFQVEVTDPTSTSERPPFVNIEWPSTTMAANEINGSRLITRDAEHPPQFDGKGRWLISFVVNTSLANIDSQSNEAHHIRFQVAALSQSNGQVSEPENQSITMMPGGSQ